MQRVVPRNCRGIEHVKLETVKQYLLEHGWQQVPYPQNPRMQVFFYEEYGYISLPAHECFSDFHARLYEAIDQIAESQDEPTYPVLQQFVEASR